MTLRPRLLAAIWCLAALVACREASPPVVAAASPSASPAGLLAAARRGGEFLIRHQDGGGRFAAHHDLASGTDRGRAGSMRQAEACRALFQLFSATGDPAFLAAGVRGLEPLLRQLQPPRDGDAAAGFMAVVSGDGQARLGSAALLLLALLEHQQVAGGESWQELVHGLAAFLAFQQGEGGRFAPRYSFREPGPRPFDPTEDPGAAVLALVRLSRLEGDEVLRWRRAAERGSGWLMGVRDLGKTYDQLPHDRWLMMALEDLYEASGGGRTYFLHARRMAEGILRAQSRDSMRPQAAGGFSHPPRTEPTARRAQALAAMSRLARRAEAEPRPYVEALELAASFLLRQQVPEQPAAASDGSPPAGGGFRRGPQEEIIDLDAVPPAISALLELRGILLTPAPDTEIRPSPPPQLATPEGPG